MQRKIFSKKLGIQITLFATLSALGCTKKVPSIETQTPTADVFADRPIVIAPDLYTITLSSPPILKFATKTKSGWQVPVAAKAKLLKEQEDFAKLISERLPDAKIVFRYRMTLNGFAIFSPTDPASILGSVPGVTGISSARLLPRAEQLNVSAAAPQAGAVNSVNFIGTPAAHRLGFTGKGMRIGILDTGIDYTHSMLGGSGNPEEFKAIKPDQLSPLFPNQKIVGGIDLVGTEFNAASEFNANHLPLPDGNPIDEAGHGTHVAGTIAGIGDGDKTYDGVAPDAQLFAIKVFGKDGSTADAIVIAGFEFAADPNGDLNPDDQLDIINMSLGGGFGQPQVLYTAATRNLSRAGTVVVASAGNSGAIDYIVGAPSTSDDAISVAASVDGALVNWQFPAIRFVTSTEPNLLVKAIEGPISKPISEVGPIEGELFDIGDASADLSEEVKAQLAGKVALIVRGKVAFSEKLKRAADAGAVGAIVYNNSEADPIPMGGEGKVAIPAIMISQAVGLRVLEQMKSAPVRVHFKTKVKIEEPLNVDTIADFSSKGPRSEDNLIKPEVAAPGQNITSAAMGTGKEGIKMDGTSMAAPHLAGALALIKQAHPELTSQELKSLVMNTAKVLKKGDEIPVTLQGGGRVQIAEAILAPVVSHLPSLSLGRVQLAGTKNVYRTIILRNLTDKELTLSTETRAAAGMSIAIPTEVVLPAQGQASLLAVFTFNLNNPTSFVSELDGRILFKNDAQVVLQIPALAVRTVASQLLASADSATGGLTIVNSTPNAGLALGFNLLGEDPVKPKPTARESWMSRSCDLQSAGYRIVRKITPAGPKDTLQFGFKVYTPLTTWHMCSLSVLIDSNADGVADQEIAGVTGGGLAGVEKAPFSTLLIDSVKAREIRLAYEKELGTTQEIPKLSYLPAVISAGQMVAFSQSSVAVLEIPLESVALNADGKIHMKLVSQAAGGETYQADNYLGGKLSEWLKVSPLLEDQGFTGLEEVIEVPTSGAALTFSKGKGQNKLVVYYPLNVAKVSGVDRQQQVLE